MNTIDNLLLIVFVAVLLFYCHKRKKFPFSMHRKTGETKESTAQNNTVQTPFQNTGFVPQMFPQGIQGYFTVPTGTAPHVTYCKIIGADSTVIDNDADLEHIINTELSKLTATGFTIQNVNAFVFNIGDMDAMHIAFCITYGK